MERIFGQLVVNIQKNLYGDEEDFVGVLELPVYNGKVLTLVGDNPICQGLVESDCCGRLSVLDPGQELQEEPNRRYIPMFDGTTYQLCDDVQLKNAEGWTWNESKTTRAAVVCDTNEEWVLIVKNASDERPKFFRPKVGDQAVIDWVRVQVNEDGKVFFVGKAENQGWQLFAGDSTEISRVTEFGNRNVLRVSNEVRFIDGKPTTFFVTGISGSSETELTLPLRQGEVIEESAEGKPILDSLSLRLFQNGKSAAVLKVQGPEEARICSLV